MVPRKLIERLVGALPLLLLPVIVAPLLAGVALLSVPEEYRSYSAIWVTRLSVANSPLGSDSIQITPSERQAQVIRELLVTQDFAEAVAVEAGMLAPRDETITREEDLRRRRTADRVRRSISVASHGFNLLSVAVEARTPELAEAINRGMITVYRREVVEETERVNEISVSYFSEQLAVSEVELDARTRALTAYLSAHPSAAAPDAVDVEYDALFERWQAQQVVVSNLERLLQDAQLEAVTAAQGQTALFKVQDPPTFPLEPIGLGIMKFGSYLAAAMAFGGAISLAYLYLVYRSDHTVRSSEDVRIAGVPVIGSIPEISARQHQRWYRRFGRRQRHFARRVALDSAGLVRPGSGEGQA